LSTGHTSLRYRALWAQLGAAGRVAIVVAIIGVLVLILSAPSIATALLTRSAGAAGAAANDQQQRQEQFKKSFDRQLAQINGRSLFFIPPRPRSPDAPPPPEPEPSAPTSYGGPALIGFVDGAAYFADGSRHAPGEKTDGRIKVTSVNPPWSATVEWEGVEFTVTLFDRDRVIYPNAPKDPLVSKTAPPPATTGEIATAGSNDTGPSPPAPDAKAGATHPVPPSPEPSPLPPPSQPAPSPSTDPEPR